MEEKQKKNRYGEDFYRSITKKVRESGLLEKPVITSGEILCIIANLAGEDYRPKSGNYILKKWGESMKSLLACEKRIVTNVGGKKVRSIVFIPKESTGPVEPLKGNEKKRVFLLNIINVLDKQEASRNNEIWAPNLRDMWEGDEGVKGIALLCKASKVLRATFGFGFTYHYERMKKTVRIDDATKLRKKLVGFLPVKKEEKKTEESVVDLNQFVRLTDIAQDAIYLMGSAIHKAGRGIEVYSLTKFVNEAPSLIEKNLSATDLKILIKKVGKEYFTYTDGSDIVSLTVDGWDKIQSKYDPKARLIELLVLTSNAEGLDNVTELSKGIGLYSLLTDCSWGEFKKLGRKVYTGKITLPANPKLEKKLIEDVEQDLIKVQEMANPFA